MFTEGKLHPDINPASNYYPDKYLFIGTPIHWHACSRVIPSGQVVRNRANIAGNAPHPDFDKLYMIN
jgi:hypothetical protein